MLTTRSIKRYKEFKEFNKRICVATDVFGRGIDIERINLAINYDLPTDADSYLHRVGRAGRFGTKGLSISFVSSEGDQEVLKSIQKRFEVALPYVPSRFLSCFLRDVLTCPSPTVNSPKVASTRPPTWPTRQCSLTVTNKGSKLEKMGFGSLWLALWNRATVCVCISIETCSASVPSLYS